jgi:phosphatidylglycerophosphatase A
MNKNQAVNFRLSDPVHFAALGFGSGLSPKAPGTVGTLAAIPFFLLFASLEPLIYLAVLGVMAMAGIWICGQTARDVGVHDHGAIVWDEFVGFFITMFMIPVSISSLFAGFVLFRFFDIVKPWPIKLIDRRLHGGFGIMFDDVLAGIFALVLMQLMHYWQWF